MPKRKKQTFSRVKAVKAISRARVGTPPAGRVIEDSARKQSESPRFRETLADLLTPGPNSRESQ